MSCGGSDQDTKRYHVRLVIEPLSLFPVGAKIVETELQEFRVSNDVLGNSKILRRRLMSDGYLFFKQLVDPARLAQVRRQVLDIYDQHGWSLPGTDPQEGKVDAGKSCAEGEPAYMPVYEQLYALKSFHEIAHTPEVLTVMGDLIDDEVFVHPKKVARMSFPGSERHTTPLHQDFVHFQGSFYTPTCWTPLHDCPVELGGLAVNPRPWSDEIFEHSFSLGAGMLKIDEEQLTGSWYTTDYELGDALIFHSLTVHKALPNITDEQIRLSLDNRYQGITDTINEDQLNPHLSAAGERWGWDDVYREWSGDNELRYYWHGLELDSVPKDMRFGEAGVADAISKAKAGDVDAIYSLGVLVEANPDSKWAPQARQILNSVSV